MSDDHVIWWPALCGNATIRDAFWNHSFTVATSSPDATSCLQHTALSWAAPAVLAVSAAAYTPYLARQRGAWGGRGYRAVASRHNLAKMAVCVLLAAVSLARLAYSAAQLPDTSPAQTLAAGVTLAAIAVALFLTLYEYMKGVCSSGVLFCFWLLMLLCDSVQFRSLILQTYEQGSIRHVPLFATFYVHYGLVLAQLVLHLWADGAAADAGCHRDLADLDMLRGDGAAAADQVARMSKIYDKRQEEFPCPILRASFLSRISWFWCSTFLVRGWRTPLTDNAVWDVRPADRVKPLVSAFYRAWLRSSAHPAVRKHAACCPPAGRTLHAAEPGLYQSTEWSNVKQFKAAAVTEKTPLLGGQDKEVSAASVSDGARTWATRSHFLLAVCRSFGPYYGLMGVYEIFTIALTFARPILLNALITFVETRSVYSWHGYLLALALLAVSVLRAVLMQLHFNGKMVTAQNIRSTIAAAAYRKAMVLSNTVRKEYSVGEIVNFMSVDAQRLLEVSFYIHHFWSAPVQIVIAMYMLWGYLGVASLAGFGAMLFLMVVNGLLAGKLKKYQVIGMQLKDARTKMLNEILNGIKVLKLYAWEGAYEARVADVRRQEVDTQRRSAYLLGGTEVSMVGAPLIFAVVAFTVFTLAGLGEFTAQVAFVSLTLVNNLTGPLTVLPHAIANLVMAWVSVRRLHTYLNAAELDPDCVTHKVKDKNSAIEVTDATFSWDDAGKPVLENVSLAVPRGRLVAVVGPVGSGKSSLVSALLGELTRNSGTVAVKGSVAYIPQESWVRNDTVEMNILFGKEKKEKRYKRVVDVCALTPDLAQLPAGDQTEIGEKGINLSGGQKQRVSLARAVYADRDIYLLDDPLSAVDVHVGKHLFDKVIGPKGVLKNKTRVLVTHALTYLPQADLVVCVQDGRVAESGTYQHLLANSAVFAELIKTYLVEDMEEDAEIDPDAVVMKSELRERFLTDSDIESIKSATTTTRQRRAKAAAAASDTTASAVAAAAAGGDRLIDTEDAETGGVKLSVVLNYFKSLGPFCLTWLIFAYILQVGTDLTANIWLSEWSEDSSRPAAGGVATSTRLAVYGSIGLGQTLAILIQVFALAAATARASSVIHHDLLHTIVRCPMAFFDTTPVGRILNRFSYDMNIVDNALRFNFTHALRGTAITMTTVIAIAYTTPIFIAILVPLLFAYYFVRKFYIISSNQLIRMVSMRASPIYANFGESIMGAVSIRAYNAQARFTVVNDHLIDGMQKPLYANMVINRWLTVGLDVLGSLVVLFAAIYAVVSRDVITGGLVGLAISYSLQVTDRLAVFVKMTSGLENNIVSVERILEYSRLPTEAAWDILETRPRLSWPDSGRIQMEAYSTRYRTGLDLILKGINVNIAPREKIGIVGRTGAGKSSMMLSLFRIIEAAGGKITIDGEDISVLGLHDLRARLTIIPQDPVLFSGTLRMNLDPFEKYTDAEVWGALEHAHLKAFITSLPEGLQHHCSEGGSNLSVGQKQLVCLARALLRKTKILVLDEATAAVDLETDDLIQATIRSEFRDCTVLTIAHRISTVMDYDRILVLDAGQILEMDSPAALLETPNSVFGAMAKSANIANADKKYI